MAGKLTVIGYRGLRHEKFFKLMKDANVFILLDVRRNPYSPNPDYQKNALKQAADEFGVKYFHVPQLGVPGAGKSAIVEGEPATFAEQIESPAAQKSLEKIVTLLDSGKSVALMCSEPNYVDCHRVRLVERLREMNPELVFDQLTGKHDTRLF